MNSFDNQNRLIKNLQFSEVDQQELLMKLWELLKWQAGKYNGIDSTSMPIEKAQDLLASLMYTLFVAASEDGIPVEVLLQKDFRSVIHRGQEILDHKRKSVKALWNNMCLTSPHIQNIYYIETIKNIDLFFKQYEIYYEAHQIPCNIGYPLMNPISDEVKGISYIEEYINRIEIENSFINKFEIHIAFRLFESNIPDYKNAYFNLCEPIFINALGRKLLGQAIYPLDISKEQRAEILAILKDRTLEDCIVTMNDAVQSICSDICIADAQAVSYFGEYIKELSVRVHSAVKFGDLSHIFVSFFPDGILMT